MKKVDRELIIGSGILCNFIGENELEVEKYDVCINKENNKYYIYDGNTWEYVGDNEVIVFVNDITNISSDKKDTLDLFGININKINDNIVELRYPKRFSIHENGDNYNNNRFIYLSYINKYSNIKCHISIYFDCSALKDSAYIISNSDEYITWKLGL